MQYDAYGKRGKPFPAGSRVFDAAGVLLSPVRWCDTETGEVERYDSRDGRVAIDPGSGRVSTFTERRPAPLRVVWYAPDLLTAAAEMLAELEREYGHGVRNGYWPDMAPLLERWRAAVRAAKGEG